MELKAPLKRGFFGSKNDFAKQNFLAINNPL
ncbi:MAG: hypothetical protein ACJAR8_002080, partial [Bacteroidia bacterium]